MSAETGPARAGAFILDLNPMGRAVMQRDIELIRKIVFAVQAKEGLRGEPVEISGYDDWVVARHVELLVHSGMLYAPGQPSRPLAGDYPIYMIKDLTNEGHDFAAAMANEGVWSEVKSKLTPANMALLPLKIVKDAGVAALNAWVMQRLGLAGG